MVGAYVPEFGMAIAQAPDVHRDAVLPTRDFQISVAFGATVVARRAQLDSATMFPMARRTGRDCSRNLIFLMYRAVMTR